MSNEETGRLIDVVFQALLGIDDNSSYGEMAEVVVGELLSRYRLTPIEDNQQETGT